MTTERQKRLLATLKENDSKEIPFHETKSSLLAKGYTEADISHAVYQIPYDGKKNYVKPDDSATIAFKNNPHLTEKVGAQILEDAKKHERTKVIASSLASRFSPGTHAQSKYEFEFMDRLGLPYFSIFFGGILIFILVVILDLPVWINNVFYVIIGGWITWTFYIRYLKK